MIIYEASEYPMGAPNWYQTRAEGASVVRGFGEIQIAETYFEDEIYEYEESSELYLPEEKRVVTDLETGVSELVLALNKTPDLIHAITPREFEELIAYIFSKNGFAVELAKRSRDGGRDVIALRSDLSIKSRFIIECKHFDPKNPVGVNLVRALYGVHMQEGANKSILATTSRFTAPARKFAEEKSTTKWAMDLKDLGDIRGWLADVAKRK